VRNAPHDAKKEALRNPVARLLSSGMFIENMVMGKDGDKARTGPNGANTIVHATRELYRPLVILTTPTGTSGKTLRKALFEGRINALKPVELKELLREVGARN